MFATFVGVAYLGIAGLFAGSKIPSNSDGAKPLLANRRTVGSFSAQLPIILAPGIKWIGEGNFTEYHLKAGVDALQRECEPSNKKNFAVSCFNVTFAYFVFKHYSHSKEYSCRIAAPCKIPLTGAHFYGMTPPLKSSRARSELNLSLKKAKLWYPGPAKARAWLKPVYLIRTGAREYFELGSVSPSLVRDHAVITEATLPNGLTDTIYGIHITSQ